MPDNNKIGVNTTFEFTPQNQFTIDGNKKSDNENIAYPGFPVEEEKPGFGQVAAAEFREQSTNVHLLNAAENQVSEKGISKTAQYLVPESYMENTFGFKPTPDGWTPKQEIEKQTNIDPKYIPVLLGAKSPQDFQFKLDDLKQKQADDITLENGSWGAKLFGGLIGLSPIGSIENFIPFASVAAKARVGSSFFNAMWKSAPSMLAASAIREGAQEMDKQDGNLGDFVKDTFIDAAFGTVLFGSLSAGSSLLNVAEFNQLKDFSKNYLKGIGFEYLVSKEGVLTGFKAVDTTGGSVGAAEVTKAQEMADSAFYKGGLFKIQYVGKGALHLLSGNIPGMSYLTGSPLVALLTSKYKSAAAFANSAFDHFITTDAEAKGGVRPQSFESKVKITTAQLTNLHLQSTALHAERNGYTSKPRPIIALQDAANAFRQKSLETLAIETDKSNYISLHDFYDEVQQVLHSGVSSEHAATNDLAAIYRKTIDDTWRDYRVAHGLPDDWMPPKTAAEYLMRVYDINYLNSHEGRKSFISVVSQWLGDSDAKIEEHLKPIKDLKEKINEFKSTHDKAFEELGRRELQLHPGREITYPNEEGVSIRNYLGEIPKSSKRNRGNANRETPLIPYQEIFETYSNMKQRLQSMEETLQDRLREDPDMLIHVDDWNNFSAKESKEFKALLKPINDIKKEIEEQKSIISSVKKKTSQKLETAKKQVSVEKAKPHADEHAAQLEQVKVEEDKLFELNNNLSLAQDELNVKAHKGEINPRFFKKNENVINFRNPEERLKFREQYESDFHRTQAAKSYLDSILHLKPEDIVADVFGKISGNSSENVLKKRTIPVSDEVLYRNNFMTKDLYAKTANYVNYLSRRTHLKTSFQNVTVNGGFEELAESLLGEYKGNLSLYSRKIEELKTESESATPERKKTIEKEIAGEEKNYKKETKDFENTKKSMKTLYENRMMGLNKRSDFDNMFRKTIMALTAASNLHNLPATQITDLAFIGFQHGIWNFTRDGIYPMIAFLGKDSEALRKVAPHVHLGAQDTLNHFADKNWSMELQPYLNMGRFVSGVQKFSHFSALTDLSPYIDNGIQHVAGSVIQSSFMEILHKSVEGTMTEKESLYLRKYGLDPKKWSERMVKAYGEAGGFKTAVGGYMSKFWEWQDLEASNEMSKAVFRGIQNTLVWKGMADSPFMADDALGMFFHTFTGWAYAATNRYLIPSLQHADGALLLKMVWMAGLGALVSPTRRASRGEKPWPDDMTDSQIAYEAFSDSGVFSSISNVLNIANFLSNDKLLGNLKNDKFANRARTGIFGMSDVISSTATRVSDVVGMAAHNEWNEKDLKTAAHMLPVVGAMYAHYISDKFIESRGLPRNRKSAQ